MAKWSTLPNRASLPMRRPNATYETDWNGHPLTITVGFDPITGRPAEVFCDAPRGGQMAETLRDAAVWASLLLQHGCDDLAKSLGRVPDYTGAETAASPLGVIAEIVKEAGA